MNIEEYKQIIKTKMGEYRFIHSVNVAKEAKALAKLYGADEQKAELAGILHDITKEFDKSEQLKIINNGGIILDSIQQNTPKLWHSISGSVYIKENLNINDEDILNAVRYHTTGRAGMSLLEKIIYVADFTSEERKYRGVVAMRTKSLKSLEDAMLYSCRFTITDLVRRDMFVHPDELACYNDIIMQKISRKGIYY